MKIRAERPIADHDFAHYPLIESVSITNGAMYNAEVTIYTIYKLVVHVAIDYGRTKSFLVHSKSVAQSARTPRLLIGTGG
jgi:hypothetical protein